MRQLTLAAIGFYRRYLSPRKGFKCAYCFHTGHSSCSTLGLRAVRRYGTVAGLIVLRRRLYLCGVAHRRYSHSSPQQQRPFPYQRGECDPGCDSPCDGGDLRGSKSCLSAGDFADCFSCDWPKRKRKEDEKNVRIPPQKRQKK